MNNNLPIIYACAALRVSSTKQGLEGESNKDQRNQIEKYIYSIGLSMGCQIKIKQWFEFVESASGGLDVQPILKAIEYCKTQDGVIKFLVVKSLDRLTRGGSTTYSLLKMQLARYGVEIIDTYGVVGHQKINTLEHLDVEYKWSIYNPTAKTELLEAERSKDEVRDILTRMIGAEIRYTRLGYPMGQPRFGYRYEKFDTEHGKRSIPISHPIESQWIIKMFIYLIFRCHRL